MKAFDTPGYTIPTTTANAGVVMRKGFWLRSFCPPLNNILCIKKHRRALRLNMSAETVLNNKKFEER